MSGKFVAYVLFAGPDDVLEHERVRGQSSQISIPLNIFKNDLIAICDNLRLASLIADDQGGGRDEGAATEVARHRRV